MLDSPWWLAIEDGEDEGEPPACADFRLCEADWGEFIDICEGEDGSIFLEVNSGS